MADVMSLCVSTTIAHAWSAVARSSIGRGGPLAGGVGAGGLDAAALLGGQPITGAGVWQDVGAWLDEAGASVLFEASPLDALTGEPASTYLRAALERGAHAITANKGPLVHAYPALRDLA